MNWGESRRRRDSPGGPVNRYDDFVFMGNTRCRAGCPYHERAILRVWSDGVLVDSNPTTPRG